MPGEVLIPLYELLVESIFGSIALAIIGVGVILFLLLVVGKSSTKFIVYWMSFYIIVTASFYNTIFLMLGFVGAAIVIVRTLFGGNS